MSKLFRISVLILLVIIAVQQQTFYKKTKNYTKNVITDNCSYQTDGAGVIKFDDNTELVTNQKTNFAMFVDSKDSLISEYIKQTKHHYQTEISNTLKKLIKPGATVVHLGGHIGSFEGLIGSLVGETGQVFTFEPNPNNFYVLRKNITLHNLDNIITAFQLGAWNRNETKELCFDYKNTGGGSLSSDSNAHLSNCVDVNLVKLDDFLGSKIDRVDLLFMDIEGAELRALEGFKDTLEKSPDCIVLMEYSRRLSNEFNWDTATFISNEFQQGKRLFRIVPINDLVTNYQELHSVEEILEIEHCDLLILPKTQTPKRLLKNIL